MTMLAIFPFIVLLSEFFWQRFILYPASLEQIKIGVESTGMLFAIRLISLGLLVSAFYLVARLISKESKKYFWFLISIVPLMSFIWMSHPIDCLKIFVVTALFYVTKKYLKKVSAIVFVTGSAIVILNIFIFKEKPSILEDISLTKAREELTLRFNIEDNITPGIKFPLLFRRVGYNKYSIAFKNVAKEAVSFFDIETLFFQEVHPLNQKAFVVFYWPQVFILGLSIFYISKNPKQKSSSIQVILILLGLSLIYFLTSAATPERRLVFTAITISILAAESIVLIYSSKNKIAAKFLTLLLALSVYGWISNIYDRSVRPDFWLDNRPIAYDFVLKEIKNNNLTNYSKILAPDTLYASGDYCKLYLEDCSKFTYENFDLYSTPPEKDVLYIGFTGNFMGRNFINSNKEAIESQLKNKGLKVYAIRHILNNIASGYGQELIVAGTQK